jgi:hypothetical protein
MADLRAQQREMARYLRAPAMHPPPGGVEPRRLKIYETLVYNNIEGFISGGFPVLRRLYEDKAWHRLVRQFIDDHRCHTPYFLEISQEFLRFLFERHSPGPDDPPFLAELAHYEWVELALSVAEEEVPADAGGDPMTAPLAISPLAWPLAYSYPVHRIGVDFRPTEPGAPVYLVVYRDRQDAVRFLSLNAATARLLERVRDGAPVSGAEVLQELAAELALPAETVSAFGAAQLGEFVERGILVTC